MSPIPTSRRVTPRRHDPVAQLRFLHEILRLATTAQTWEELLETVVDGTRVALHASVVLLYLLDRDGLSLTLAATNGLDRHHIGRGSVPFGEGITGRVAATREPIVVDDIAEDPRFLWVRGLDQRRFVASMLSVPLTWHDQIVGRPQHPDRDAPRVQRVETSPSSPPSRTSSRESSRRAGSSATRRPRSSSSGPRPGAQRADRAGHPRAPDATRRGPRLHRPALRGAAARRAVVAGIPGAGARRAPRGTAGTRRADRAARPPRRFDPGVGPGRAGPARAAALDRPAGVRRGARRGPGTAAAPAPARHRPLAAPARPRRSRPASARSWSTCWRTP